MINIRNPLIQISNLTKIYRGNEAVSHLNLDIPTSSFALLGPNGAGKTTTILMILGLISRTSGRVNILGKEIPRELNYIRNEIGYLPENVGLFPHMTGMEHIRLFQRLKIRGATSTKEDLEARLEWCGLDQDKWYEKVKIYSRGMRQRLGLALAFAGNPKIVILDEPLSNVDPLGRDDLIKKIREKYDKGISVIISSHIMQEIEQIAEHIAIIDKGKLLISGSFIELAIEHGYLEFEIKSLQNKGDDLMDIFKFIKSHQELLLNEPVKLDDKVIIKSRKAGRIQQELATEQKSWLLKPLDGILIKIYKDIVRGEHHEIP
jgi:ABC-type multidrug transport system ATPase subunit